MTLSTEQCVAELREALSHRPANLWDPNAWEWYADVAAIVSACSAADGSVIKTKLDWVMQGVATATPQNSARAVQAAQEITAIARTIYTALRLETNAFVTKQVDKGQVFDYFREVRDIIRSASRDILFIDPYLDSDFIDRYLPEVPNGVTVRLLSVTRQLLKLKCPLELFNKQHGTGVQLRTLDTGLHDRHVLIDRRDAYQSGASFKDGAKNAPTSINQIVDVAAAMVAAHEARWASATVVL